MAENATNKFKTLSQGALAPLFDRLIDTDPGRIDENPSSYILTPQALQQSVFQHLEIVLNTRPTAKNHYNMLEDQNTINLPTSFGLREFSWADASRQFTLNQIKIEIERVIMRYEPRLTQVNVTILGRDATTLGLSIVIRGQLQTGDDHKRVHFPMMIEHIFYR